MKNNIQLIEEFISCQSKNKLIINYLNDELIEFYYGVAKFFCMKNKIQLSYYNNNSDFNLNNDDLFQLKKILTIKSSNSKKIEIEIKKSEKSIIFVDYKNYKLFRSNDMSINGYDFLNDIKFMFNNYLKISNNDLINFCTQFPAYLFSEISKYEVNNHYVFEKISNSKIDKVFSIRKSIFDQKKTKKNLKVFYENIRDEAKYKKFNFLIY